MSHVRNVSMEDLEKGLDEILQSPKEAGVLEMICRRPQAGVRELLEQAELDVKEGLVGDNWIRRGSSRTKSGAAHPDMQLTIMNTRVISLIAGDKERWHLAGDQLFMDLDLTPENLPQGSRISLGSSIIEVTAQPHTGCKKFVQRFGADATSD